VMSILIAALIKTTIVLAGALAVSRALRHHSAAARHLVWTCGLLAVLVLPLASLAVPRWEVPLVMLDSVVPPVRTVEGEASRDANVAAMEARLRDRRTPVARTPSQGTSDVNPSPAAAPSWTTVAIGVWAIGAIALLGRLLVGIVVVRLMARRTEPAADAAWVPVASELARDLGVTHVEFRQGERGTMPTAWGVLRPVVLMPADAEAWPKDRLRVVLLHELAHVKRADCLTHILAQAACAIHWINPLAWTAVRQARIERERACDDLVLTRGTSDVHYADQLLEIARAMRASRFSAAMAGASLAMAHRSQLEGRLMAILDPSVPRTPPSRARAAAAGAFAFAALIPLASVQPFAYAVVPQLPGETRPAVKPAAPPEDTTQNPPRRPAPVGDNAVASRRASGMTDAVVAGIAGAIAGTTLDAVIDSVPAAVAGALEQAASQQPNPKPNPNPNPNPKRDDDEQAKPADPKVIAALMTALKDSDKEVRETAMQALVRLRAPGMFEPLVEALKDQSPDVREQAAFGLGQLRDKRAVAPLTAALKDSAANVREQAVFALGQLRDASTIDALTIALRDESASVREQAAFALGQLRDEKSVPPLISALKDASPGVREQAAFALGQIRSQAAVDALMAALKDSSASVREQAAFALGQLGDARALDALTAALKDASADVRQQAAFAIGQLAR
jgi:HEAT repeat protein/beta-lactamase regulating signal transducer with metallopeptidase domain